MKVFITLKRFLSCVQQAKNKEGERGESAQARTNREKVSTVGSLDQESNGNFV